MDSRSSSTTLADPDLIHLGTLHPDDGRALRYHLDEQMIGWIETLAGIVARHPCFESVCSVLNRDLLTAYLEQAFYLELLDTRRALVRRQYAASQGLRFDKPVSCPGHLLELVRTTWPEPRIPLRASRSGMEVTFKSFLKERVIERAWRWRHASSSPRMNRVMVGVELVEGVDPDAKSDAFWLANKAFDADRTLFVFERHNSFFLDPAAELLNVKRIGAHAVALHPGVSANGAIALWYPQEYPGWATALKDRLPAASNSLERWLRATLLHCVDRVAYWEAFFEWHRVAVFQQFTEFTLETTIKRLAMSRTGGIELGKMRSEFFELSSAAFHFQHQAAFVWHRSVRGYLEAGRTRTQCLVETGYVYDHLFETLKPAAANMRAALVNAGVKLVIAVYDNMPHVNGHFTQSQLLEFYECVIEVAERDSSIGLLVKSKKPHVLNALPQLRQRLSALETAGRCRVISTLGQTVAIAALACDVAIGFPASTALCETLLAGRRGLMYDPGGAASHPFQDLQDRIIFQDIVEFKAALHQLLEDCALSPVDLWPGIRSILDKYQDGMSHVRAARFIGEFLQAHESGLAPLAGMQQAVARLPYCEITATRDAK